MEIACKLLYPCGYKLLLRQYLVCPGKMPAAVPFWVHFFLRLKMMTMKTTLISCRPLAGAGCYLNNIKGGFYTYEIFAVPFRV